MEEKLFYSAYERFYAMARTSQAFGDYCHDAFGADFSQDGFSDVGQIARVLEHIRPRGDLRLLDVGCGNGKMLAWLQQRLGGAMHGFDYAEAAIRTARELHQGDFRVGVMGEIDYPENSFDLITAMDTLYFAPDMSGFVAQLKCWLKPGGVLFAGYQEGDVQPRTADAASTVLARALEEHGLVYQVEDITRECYDLLRRKRACAQRHRDAFLAEGNGEWYDMLIGQTEDAMVDYSVFRERMARYIFVAKK
ncbi:MAG: methyltransferase domain-containing protein [Clostridiales bacterium]|nr:methyltransferase domain-containing protein [Clostridiales bacterium]